MTMRSLLGTSAALTSVCMFHHISCADEVPTWLPAARQSVAQIEVSICAPVTCKERKDPPKRLGTAFLYQDPDTRKVGLVTAYHVVAGASEIRYRFAQDGATEHETTLIGVDPANDLAFLALQDDAGGAKQLQAQLHPANDQDAVWVVGFTEGVKIGL